MKPFIAIALVVIALIFGFAVYQTWLLGIGQDQRVFQKGTFPNPLPNGDYKGDSNVALGLWQGKYFDSKTSSGINLFKAVKLFRFKTYPARGERDKNLKVLKIDYNIEENALLIRPFLDEIVQTSPGKYLGKVHVRIIPNFPFTLAFFRLEPGPYKLPTLF